MRFFLLLTTPIVYLRKSQSKYSKLPELWWHSVRESYSLAFSCSLTLSLALTPSLSLPPLNSPPSLPALLHMVFVCEMVRGETFLLFLGRKAKRGTNGCLERKRDPLRIPPSLSFVLRSHSFLYGRIQLGCIHIYYQRWIHHSISASESSIKHGCFTKFVSVLNRTLFFMFFASAMFFNCFTSIIIIIV